MFGKRRAITLTMDKKTKGEVQEITIDPKVFETKVDIVLHKLSSLGAKMFLGVCVYVALDTIRQVAVANAIYNQPKESTDQGPTQGL